MNQNKEGSSRLNGMATVYEGCHDVKHIPVRCKGKFCPNCAGGESQCWSEMVSEDRYHTIHRHIVFTIDEGARKLFPLHRKGLLKGLMDEAANVVQMYFRKKRITPGIIAGLHTFESELEFNPHVHMIVTMGGLSDSGEWENYDYITCKLLRVHWQNAVLKLLRRTLTAEEKKAAQPPLLQKVYIQNAEDFYVNAPKRSRTNVMALFQYISRYMKRGPISLARIIYYDGDTVLFRYHDKHTNKEAVKIMVAKEFILSLIRHYSLYSRRIKTVVQQIVCHLQEKMEKLLISTRKKTQPKKWHERITETFGMHEDICERRLNGLIRKHTHKQEKAQKEVFENHRFDWEELRQRSLHRERDLYLSSM